MFHPTDPEVLEAIAAATRPATPADIREMFGPDVDAADLMPTLRILR